MHTIRVITRIAYNTRRTDRASASSRLCLSYVSATPQLRLDYALASISCEHCRSSRNNPHYAPRHIIYYNLAGASDFWKTAWPIGFTKNTAVLLIYNIDE